MPPREGTKQRVPGADAAADVARCLDKAQVPHVLWGKLALGLVGQFKPCQEVDFVIPDDHLESASNALGSAGFTRCCDSGCVSLEVDQERPISDIHFHIEGKYSRCTILCLLAKSKTLWWLPDFPLDAPAESDPHLLVTTDTRLPPYVLYGCTGPWSDLYPVKVLNPSAFTESIMLLFCRDDHQPNCLTDCWIEMSLDLMGDAEDPDTIVDKNLRPQFQSAWDSLNRFPPKGGNIYDEIRHLREDLIRNKELPSPPAYRTSYHIDYTDWMEKWSPLN